MSAIAERIVLNSDALKANHLDLSPGLQFDEWSQALMNLVNMESCIQWWLGDAILYGESEYGERCYQAVCELTIYQKETVKVAAWVCSKFPPVARRTDLSFGHYKTVAALEAKTASELLNKAVKEKLSVRDLGAEVRTAKDIALARSVVGRGATAEHWEGVGQGFKEFDDRRLILYALMISTRITQGLHLQIVEAINETEIEHEIENLKDRLLLKSAAWLQTENCLP